MTSARASTAADGTARGPRAASFQASYGTTVPAGEVVLLPKLPLRLDKVQVQVGDTPSGQIGMVTSSDLVVQAVVDGTDAQLLRQGTAVRMTTSDGKVANGVVASIGSGSTGTATAGGSTNPSGGGTSSGQSSADNASAPVQVKVSVSDPKALAGQSHASVMVTFQIGGSKGRY